MDLTPDLADRLAEAAYCWRLIAWRCVFAVMPLAAWHAWRRARELERLIEATK